MILKLSEHTKDRVSVTFEPDEALALLEGFGQMADNNTQAADIIEANEQRIEELESKLSKKGKLWRPGA